MKKGYHEYEPMKGNKPEKPEFVSKGRISEYNKERRAKKLKEQKDLMKMKKAELIEMANKLSLDVNSKNTKAEIVAAIEKQSR